MSISLFLLIGALVCLVIASFPTVFRVSKVALGMLAGAFLVAALIASRMLA
jgi:hypothetical protein